MSTPTPPTEPGHWSKLVGRVSGNLEGRGIAMKTAKVGGAALGGIVTAYGVKDIGQYLGFIAPNQDEQGREIKPDTGQLLKGLGEVGLGMLTVHQLLLKGKAGPSIHP
jgi:hypothetical protein